MATQIKLRRDSYQNWFDNNPVLGQGEPGYDITNSKLKIGDGSTTWRLLPYFDDQQTDLSAYAGDIIPSADNTYDIGSPTNRWRHGYFATGSLYVGDIKLSNLNGTLIVQQVTDAGLESEAEVPDTPGVVTTDRIVNGMNSFAITAAGVLELNGSPFTGGNANTGDFGFSGNVAYNLTSYDQSLYIAPGGESTSYVRVPGNSESTNTSLDIWNGSQGGVRIGSSNGTWEYRADSVLRADNSFTKTTANTIQNGSSVVWTASENFISGAKLVIQVEANEVGDATGWHSQVCEAVIASRGYANTFGGPGGTPVMTVYGVTYTSTAPLVTFTVQRNPTTKFIEVVATSTAAADTPPNIRIYSVETATND